MPAPPPESEPAIVSAIGIIPTAWPKRNGAETYGSAARLASAPAYVPGGPRKLRTIEFPFPRLLVFPPLADEGREHGDIEQEPVDEIRREAHRPDEIEEQHDPRALRSIPRLVLEGIVEHHGLPFPPVVELLIDADRALLARLRHLEAKMQPQHAVIRHVVRRDVFSRLQNREHRGLEARHRPQDAPGL